MLRRNKSLSIIMALCLCLALLAPVFVAPPAAEAASTGSVVQTGSLGQFDYSAIAGEDKVGVIKVEVTDFDYRTTPTAANPWIATASFPTKLSDDFPVVDRTGNGQRDGAERIWVTYGTGDNAFAAGDVILEGSNVNPNVAALGTFDIKVQNITNPNSENGKGIFYIHFADFDCTNFAGDVVVNIKAGSGAFSDMVGLKIATVNAAGKTTASAKSVRKITTSGGPLDNIIIFDVVPGTIGSQAGNIVLEMKSKGFSFANPNGNTSIQGYHRFDGNFAGPLSVTTEMITFPQLADVGNGQQKGMVGLVNVFVRVDEKVARVGQDIEVKVSGAGITEETIVVGQYVDYLVNITLDKSSELIAGRSGNDDGQVLGTFFIEEVAPGTLVEDRSIILELPAGLAWDQDEMGLDSGDVLSNFYAEVVNNSSIQLTLDNYIDNRTMKLLVDRPSSAADEGAKILFKNLAVDVSPAYRGDVTLKVSGKAGAEGEVIVSKVIPMITMEASTPEVKLGVKEQKVADVVVTESKADALVDREAWTAVVDRLAVVDPDTSLVDIITITDSGVFDTALKFYLDDGFRFSKVPKVEVLEGDVVLELDDVKITTPRSGQNLLIIPIRAGSFKTPAKIKISDIYITADRNAPTGKIALYAAETASDLVSGQWISDYANAFNDTGRFALDRAAECYIADNKTVPPVENEEVGSGTFVIGSNLYTVNGVTRVMDVAPYIKNDRTYVPYRYLAYVLGVAEEDVVWDQSAQTVTLTLGDTTVVATIGSTTLTVNGESVVMDVAPEIYEGRTMLPARWLAEALGATVGWDGASRTVVVEF